MAKELQLWQLVEMFTNSVRSSFRTLPPRANRELSKTWDDDDDNFLLEQIFNLPTTTSRRRRRMTMRRRTTTTTTITTMTTRTRTTTRRRTTTRGEGGGQGHRRCQQQRQRQRQKTNYEANNGRNLTKLTTHYLFLYQIQVWPFFLPNLPPIMVKKCLM